MSWTGQLKISCLLPYRVSSLDTRLALSVPCSRNPLIWFEPFVLAFGIRFVCSSMCFPLPVSGGPCYFAGPYF
ncbi:hypothetical protein BDZ91DRAFT_748539 [Kalaharituber pfeilii]|nr:hypothetical protein BDZ91DRAFT_748539 [Kalaharituber pfeilii]